MLHLLASAAVAATFVVPFVLASYPAPLLGAVGGVSLLVLLVAVDVVSGPLLTFVVFDPTKPELRRDLRIIFAIQAVALAYGLHSAALARPVLLTFVVDRFEIVSAAEVDADELRRAPPQFHELSWTGPVLAAARRPTDAAERETVLLAGLSGIDLRHMFRHYVPYGEMAREVSRRARPIEVLKDFNDAARVDQAVRSLIRPGEKPDVLRWLPVQGRSGDLVAFVEASGGALRGVVNLAPWN